MKNRIRFALVAVAALCSGAALATLTNVENAYETDTGHATLPANARGQVVIRECAGCKPVVLRANRETRYFLGSSGVPVTLSELRAAAAVEGSAEHLLTVFYSLDTGFVTRVVLSAN